jgi:ABC-type uncharacterized transport system substrate-binding protein
MCTKNNQHTSEELKQNVQLCMSHITEETLYQVASKTRKRVKACIAACGGHFQHLI